MLNSYRNGKRKSYSAGSITSSSNSTKKNPDFENFFEEPQIKVMLDARRESFLRHSTSAEVFPVAPPDLEVVLERSTKTTPNPTPRTVRKQLRFDIPEVHISFETNEPRKVTFEGGSTSNSIVPPPIIDWDSTPKMNSVPEIEPILCFDDEVSVTTRRLSANEKARQNVIAQRRQSNVQLVQSMSGRTTTTTLIPLTCAQIHLVRALWRQVYTTKGPTVIGASIYHRLCFKNVMVKEQMKQVELPPKFQNRDNFIKAHCKAVAELIDQVVENLDHLDNVTGELMRIGRVHAKVLRGELTGKLWNTVAETIIDCTLEWGDRRCRSETVRKAWALIVAFVIEKIKAGHHEQRKLMLGTRQSLPSIRTPSMERF
uniref:Globin n=1 Tax=Caenorhabditis elegans TaxID=6239 RepID=G5EBR4_CAEEL|nr:globin [Caenorhabditis elegans]|eukprot:NP_492107.2 GLoBin related [Caenorhabditis elegans]